MRVAIRETRVQICMWVAMRIVTYSTRVVKEDSRVWQSTYRKVKWKAGWIVNASHVMPIYSVQATFNPKVSFCVPTYEVSVLKWRSAIWVDNRCPLMCEVRGKRWSKYIIIIIFGEIRNPMEQRQYLKQIHNNVIYKVISEDVMFNLLEHQLFYNI